MKKIRMAVCIGDEEYQKRLLGCLFLYYRNEIEVSVYSHPDQLEEGAMQHHVILCGDFGDEVQKLSNRRKEPIVYLVEDLKDLPEIAVRESENRIHFLEKYQSIDNLVKEITTWIEGEIHVMKETASFKSGTRVVAIYALSDCEMQLPYVVTLASVLGEKERVLVLDLQENSGLSGLSGENSRFGLEELMVMAENEEYSEGRIRSCISHRGGVDFIAPADSSECICEGNAVLYGKMLMMLKLELGYDWILLSLGSRFEGFFECLRQCNEVHLIGKTSGMCKWREAELKEELDRRGYKGVLERMRRVSLPNCMLQTISCERVVEEWKWNELGDMIRGEMRCG